MKTLILLAVIVLAVIGVVATAIFLINAIKRK